MSYADTVFINMVRDILDNGCSTEGEKVRPHWEDGTSAYTIKKFGVVNRYDLRKEFPIITLRKTALKSATDELLWIWQKKSNNVNELSSHIWDEWADETGSIGKAYGYQMGVKHQYKEGMMDQVDRVIFDLKNNPFSRRIMTNIYVHQDLHEMNLYPCAYSMTFNVTQRMGEDKLTLNAILNQIFKENYNWSKPIRSVGVRGADLVTDNYWEQIDLFSSVEKQQNVYESIMQYQRVNGYAPTIREICKMVGVASTSSVYAHLKILEEKGYIARKLDASRAIAIL